MMTKEPFPPLLSAAGVKARLARFGLTPNKALGQNFLIDPAARAGILDCLPMDLPVLEIGPGLGALTEGLIERGHRVLAVEKDRAMVAVLKETLPAAEVIEGDFLDVDLSALHARLGGGPFLAAGNLPYYATTPIAMKLLSAGLPIEAMALMVQREAVERFLAGPGSRVYGPLSVLTGLQYEAKEGLRLSPASYYPPPEVHSGVVILTRREGAAIPPGFPQFLTGIFAMRRKTLLNNLLSMGHSKPAALAAIGQTGLRPEVRAEAVEAAALPALFRCVMHDYCAK